MKPSTGQPEPAVPRKRVGLAVRGLPGETPGDAMSHAVFRTMSGTDATLERFAWLGDGLAAAVWYRSTPEAFTEYRQPGHHTLSCYLGGGYKVEREGLPGQYGAPERLCALPDWHESEWVVRGQLRMLHVYFMPEHFTRRAVVELDREPRELTLQDRTYFENERLVQLCGALLQQPWDDADQLMRANEITHEALSELLRSQSMTRLGLRLRGGLAPLVRRRLHEFIEAHLHENITLGMLAQLACMSEFHLARMFRISFGVPPSTWIAARRIERARGLLRAGRLPLQHVAQACGYADVSHFTHRFSEAVRVPPARYRALLGKMSIPVPDPEVDISQPRSAISWTISSP